MRLMRNALILFAKEPIAGKVKTRLVPFLSHEKAAELYHCMLLDTVNKAAKLEHVVVFLFYDGGETAAALFRSLAPGFTVMPQQGADLGERMQIAFEHVFGLGYEKVAIVGTDSPDLPMTCVEKTLRVLGESGVDAVFGPSDDGGYYLLALKQLYPELFEGIAWSSPTVLADSLAKAGSIGINAVLLAPWHDVDTVEDLLRPELLDEENGAHFTRAFIQENMLISKLPAGNPAHPDNQPLP